VVTRRTPGAQLVTLELTAGASAQLGLLALLSVGVGLGPAGWLAGTAYAVVTLPLLASALRRARMRSLGPANQVTLARATLVGGVTALVTDAIGRHAHVAVLIALAAVALVLDAVDGQVARRTGTTSSLGARFDMEVDAFLILVLSIFVATSLGAWVLTIGAMRYVFVAAAWVMRWLRSPLPPSLARKAVAAVQGIVLTVASAGVVPRSVAIASVVLSLALLVWSFGRDIVWLWRERRQHMIPSA
jgi:phosphatidylglycerophosphate synthase